MIRNAYHADDLHSRKQRAEVRADHLLERHEVERPAVAPAPIAADSSAPSRARSGSRRARDRESRPRATARDSRCTETDGPDRRRAASAPGKICDSKYSSIAPHSLAVRSLHAEQAHAVIAKAPRGARRGSRAAVGSAATTSASIASSCSCGVSPSGGRLHDAGRDLPAQARDANHVELVQVRAEDGRETSRARAAARAGRALRAARAR